jgi:hypothetical protein
MNGHLRSAPGEGCPPRLVRAYAWWREKAGARALPDRSDFDPTEIPDLMPHMVMWDVLPAGGYRCRLAGTRMVEIHGRGELTGLSMAEFHGPANAEIQPDYDSVVATGLPHQVERTLYWLGRDHRRYARILLPFTFGGTAVAIIANVAEFDGL